MFRRVIADPTSPDARLIAQAVFAELERRARPSRVHRERLTKHAVLWWSLGFGSRCRAVLQRWRREDPRNRELSLAETHFAIRAARPQATARLADVRDVRAAALAVIHLVLAGEPRAALALARSHGWFATRRDLAVYVLMFVGWALGLTRSPEAEHVLAIWKRHAAGDPEWFHHVLKAEAEIAMHACQFPRELSALRAAHALSIDHDLGMQRVAVEVTLPCAFAHNADLAAARAVMARWSAPSGDYVPLDAGHDLARAEVELIAERWDESEKAARRALRFFEASDLVFHACMAASFVAIASPRSRFSRALDEFRRIVHRVSVPFYRERFQLLERFAARGVGAIREVQLVERSRYARRVVSFVHVLFPRPESIAADIYWDRVQHRIWLRGQGPYWFDDHPMLAKVLEAIASTDGFALPLAELFEAVWRVPYNPLVHENKAHVTLHRLRQWLEQRAEGMGRAVMVRDGVVSIAEPVEMIVLSPPLDLDATADEQRSTVERVAACLDQCSPLTARELQRRLSISRSALHAATRRLLAEGRITRTGRGPAVRYSSTTWPAQGHPHEPRCTRRVRPGDPQDPSRDP